MMKRFLLFFLLAGISHFVSAQNPEWLTGEWNGVIVPNNTNNTDRTEITIRVDANKSQITLWFVAQDCTESWDWVSTDLHSVSFEKKSLDQKNCSPIDELHIQLMDNNYISIQFIIVHERFFELVGSARMKKM